MAERDMGDVMQEGGPCKNTRCVPPSLFRDIASHRLGKLLNLPLRGELRADERPRMRKAKPIMVSLHLVCYSLRYMIASNTVFPAGVLRVPIHKIGETELLDAVQALELSGINNRFRDRVPLN